MNLLNENGNDSAFLQNALQSLGMNGSNSGSNGSGSNGSGEGGGSKGIAELLSKLGSDPSLMDGMQKGMRLMNQMDKLDKMPVKSKKKNKNGRTNKHKK